MNARLEDQLRSSLNRTADARPASAPDLGDVFGRARTIRRRRTGLVAGVAAAAVLAVVVPTAVIMSSDDSGQHGIAPSTSTPDPSQVSTPTSEPSATAATDAPTGLGIGGVSIGEHTAWSYLDPQQHLHAGGASIPAGLLKHDGAPLQGFTPYHGGWITTYDLATVVSDNTGKILQQGKGGSLAVSSDGTRAAWQIGNTVTAGIASGMSDTESTWHLKQDETLQGFLGDGPVVSAGNGSFTVLGAQGRRTTIASEVLTTTASDAADLVGGVLGSPATTYEGAVADGTTGQTLWHNEWRPMAFSPDGRYVAAVPVGDNGDPSAYAILDARSGAVIAQTPDSIANKVYLGWQVVWESDDSILFQGFEAGGERRAALLRLTTDGLFNQASEPLKPVTTDQGEVSFVLMTP